MPESVFHMYIQLVNSLNCDSYQFFPLFYFQIMNLIIENPWNIQSIYDLQFFNCPTCEFKNHSKQEFVNHAFGSHPASIEYLSNIRNDSFNDIMCPWDIKDVKIEENVTENSINDPLDVNSHDQNSFEDFSFTLVIDRGKYLFLMKIETFPEETRKFRNLSESLKKF